MIAVYIFIGFVLGVPFGWALLFLLAMYNWSPKRPPTKDEWKVM